MHLSTALGKKGEDLAAEWLTTNGFIILHRNWRHGRYEVDIIAGRKDILHIIEVKLRTSTAYGHPEESVSKRKFQHIMQGAAGWLVKFPDHKRIQYDVLAITLRKATRGNSPTPPEFLLFEDVYL